MNLIQMSETEKLLSMADKAAVMNPDYLDDDLMIIDNIKILGVPGVIRPNMNIIAICTNGKLQMTMDKGSFVVEAHQVFICPPETIIDNLMVSTDFEYVALCITNRALQVYLRGYIEVWNEFTYIRKKRIFDMNDIDMKVYEKVYDLIRLCLENSADNHETQISRDLMKGVLSAAIIGLCQLLKRDIMTSGSEAPRPKNISYFNQFLELLQTLDIKYRPVEYYASELCISPKYLTIISKKNSGKTANDWIREYTLADITYELQNTTLSIKEISNKLGFSNTSFFGKFVKEHLGCTPLEYRNQKKPVYSENPEKYV